ncbi:MAG: hypothetical protein IPP40_18300 [bacterium]|nr:hypothetical protein [bacterium]
MKLAPRRGRVVFSVVAKLGVDVVFILGKFVLVVLSVLALQMFGVYGFILESLSRSIRGNSFTECAT